MYRIQGHTLVARIFFFFLFRLIILLLANFLIGFTDSCLHVEAYNYIGSLYPDNSAPAFAVFKFVRVSTREGRVIMKTLDKCEQTEMEYESRYCNLTQF